MKVVNVNLVVAQDKVKLVIDRDVVYEGENIAIDSLFTYIQNACQGPVILTLKNEFTPDMDQWEKEHLDTALITQGEVEITEVGELERDG